MKLYTYLSFLCLGQIAVSDKIINCYWGTWANYRPGEGKFEPANIDPSLCSHISYTFFGISEAGEFISLDPWLDLDSGLGFISKTIALKQRNPKLKILAVVGGWNEGSTKYSAMAADAAKRSLFISSTLSFIQSHRFDGLDLDWEYPGQRGGSAADRANFVTLLRELKDTFEPHGLELSIAVGASKASASISYDIPAISQHLSFINVMTYDFHMSLDGYLGFNAPLPEVQKSIDYWLQQGAPAEKLILGIGFYGHTYKMADSSQNRPGAASIGPGSAGIYTRESGFLGYNEICLNNWQTVFDEGSSAPYAFQGDQWVGYDNVRSIQLKMELVKSHNLGGAMMWSIETDDFRGRCGESFPLLKTINRAIYDSVSTAAPATSTTQSGANGNGGQTTSSVSTAAPTTSTTQSGANGNGNDCQKDGFFLHESDCSSFYRCVGGRRFDFQCGGGLYFDTKVSSCNWSASVKCPY